MAWLPLQGNGTAAISKRLKNGKCTTTDYGLWSMFKPLRITFFQVFPNLSKAAASKNSVTTTEMFECLLILAISVGCPVSTDNLKTTL